MIKAKHHTNKAITVKLVKGLKKSIVYVVDEVNRVWNTYTFDNAEAEKYFTSLTKLKKE